MAIENGMRKLSLTAFEPTPKHPSTMEIVIVLRFSRASRSTRFCSAMSDHVSCEVAFGEFSGVFCSVIRFIFGDHVDRTCVNASILDKVMKQQLNMQSFAYMSAGVRTAEKIARK